MSSNEPRALTAALASPAFVTRGGGLAMHAANRHVSRWAPEVGEEGANRIRPLRNLGFVDRLVSPWIESAQRSPSLRMFSQYISSGAGERPTSNVSWVFPRPWYQDELDWMAAARAVGQQSAIHQPSAPQMLTTRGTYVAPSQPSAMALPTALYEFVAPSLSIARPDPSGVSDAYSPLVPLAATHAAQVMARVVAPMMTAPAHGAPAAARMSPGLRAVLSTMLERSAFAPQAEPTRLASYAPELVTPPAPRAPIAPSAGNEPSVEALQAVQVAEQYAEQRVRIAELQRVARVAAERELAIREVTRPETRSDRAAAPAAASGDTRQLEQRQAEVVQRTSELAAQRTAERVSVEAERARIEQRISQRIAERTTQQAEAQRLHASARDAAARDARTGLTPSAPAPTDGPAVPDTRAALEIAAAVAALPPELSSMVAASIGSRPERAVQAIAELGEALRAVELMARNTASGGTVATTRGPRLVMPSGLGGLVATVERTSGGDRGQPRMPSAFAAPIASAAPMPTVQSRGAMPSAMRVPAMAFLADPSGSGQSATMAPTSALGAASAATPAALSHVAWSDRWLARFAGAKSQSLDMLAATSAAPEMRLDMLAAAAPGTVFVAPFFDDRARSMPAPVVAEPIARAVASQSLARYDDDAETPDDVLMAIASAANRTRSAAAAPVAVAAPTAAVPTFDRETLADLVAHAPPQAPGAGLSAGLASSPFAPALRHVLPLGSAPTFDVRSLFGGGLGATYLAGLLAASTDELSIAAPTLPSWATWADPALGAPSLGAFDGEPAMRDVADWQPTYVAPEQPHPAGDSADLESAQVAAEMAAPLTTLRSALLSFDIETIAAQSGTETRVSQPSITSSSTPLARTMLDSMSMPMLAETAAFQDVGALEVGGTMAQASSYAAPGMIADRAHAWSIAQERSTSDLAFDFVTPELVLAARVYGLGPAEAAQAARLAIAGPGQLTAMAGAVDRTFVQALAIESERRGERGTRAVTAAYPVSSGDAASASVTRTDRTEHGDLRDEPLAMPGTTTFGVERRAPRGAFLWPAATTAALGMTAAAPDGELSMSVAALELLAAQAVAELGTYAALAEHRMVGADGVDVASGGPRGAAMTAATGGEPGEIDVLASAEAMIPSTRRDKFQALYVALGQSTTGRSWSPAARAARALALAGRGDENTSARERAAVAWDVMPFVVGLGELETESTGEAAVRASRRRDELRTLDPMFADSRPGLGALSARAGEALGSYVTPSAGVSSSTGSASSGASSSSSRDVGAVFRAPTAAQEMVQTGRPSGRAGGGEVELPAWFEAAARKMLEDRSSVSDGISLAELTFVQTAAPQQLAASSRHEGGATHSVAPAPSAAAGAEADKIDVEKVANDVYREILLLMDLARSRNGEPYL